MDEQNQMPEQDIKRAQAEHTKQNNEDAIKFAKGAATYLAGPEGAPVVNQLHNTPGIGQALGKAKDKAAEKLGKNRAFSNMANQLGDSGMLQAGNQALDMANSAGSGANSTLGAKGSDLSGGNGQQSANAQKTNGLGGLPGKNGSDSSPGGNNPASEGGNEKSASENTVEGVKKTVKVIKFIAPSLPI